jgi:hypothetical protein
MDDPYKNDRKVEVTAVFIAIIVFGVVLWKLITAL